MRYLIYIGLITTLLGACDGSPPPQDSTGPVRLACPVPAPNPPDDAVLENTFPAEDFGVIVNAAVIGKKFNPVWRDHYDLSYNHLRYGAEAGFDQTIQDIQPRSWRISVGRWEIGMPPPAGATSDDPQVLRMVEREFYRGENTLQAADQDSNYDFTYLDSQLDAMARLGVEPYISFDYMPFTLAKQQDTNNPFNLSRQDSSYSFSNGIRTSAPANPAVYARVLRNTIKHILQRYPDITYFEMGNEVDLNIFWAGTRQEWIDTYHAIAQEIQSDASLANIKIGAASFSLPLGKVQQEEAGGQVTFMREFMQNLNGARLDFVSYHSYSDAFSDHFKSMTYSRILVDTFAPSAELINGEWGPALDRGLNALYDKIEHGILRSKIIMAMQLHDVRIAHESLLRDPFTQDCAKGQLGLIRTGPVEGKPAYWVYRGLAEFNDNLNTVQALAPQGGFVMAGMSDTANSLLIVLLVESMPNAPRNIDFQINDLPWGATGTYEVLKVNGTTAGMTAVGSGVISNASPLIRLSVQEPQLLMLRLKAL